MIHSHWRIATSLPEFMESISHREYLTRLAWLEEQWNRPTLSDYYQMQTACEVRRVLSKKPNGIKLAHFVIKFVKKEQERVATTAKQAASWAKSKWFGFLGIQSPKDDE